MKEGTHSLLLLWHAWLLLQMN